MRNCLRLTYWSLLSVTFLTSCLLLIAVVSQNVNYATATVASITTTTTTTTTNAEFQHVQAAPPIETNKKTNQLEDVAPVRRQFDVNGNAAKHDVDLNNKEHIKKIMMQNVEETFAVPLKLEQAASAKKEGEHKTQLPADQAYASKDVVIESEVPKLMENVVQMPKEENCQTTSADVVQEAMHKDEHTKSKTLLNADKTNNDDAINDENLPDMTIIPKVTVTDLPLEMLEPLRGNVDAGMLFEHDASQIQKNHSLDALENSNEAINKDEQIIKINDSGGGEETTTMPITDNDNISDQLAETNASKSEQMVGAEEEINNTAAVNLTVEEVPIPLFSEWAQKQMEAAEKQEALQQEVVNNSIRNHTNSNGKALPPLKLRSKNYASPDCGAKIIASNADASNTGAVLSSSKDEYMLNPCGNRIWFVVELCEAIQARRIDLANFELFSSSPKNFSVAVSNRFPTRDWSNVGRFVADDKRTVQSFELHPHLFGKFVRVDIHSHYSKEHFCPVSLFRVFGTSEFEAFETENQPEELDELEDELEQTANKAPEQNLFKSASDAVLSIVKKAAEVLAKPVASENRTLSKHSVQKYCRAPALEKFGCTECSMQLVERINNVLASDYKLLNNLLNLSRVRLDLLHTLTCRKYGVTFNAAATTVKSGSYYASMLPDEYVGALCQLLASRAIAQQSIAIEKETAAETDNKEEENAELPLNLTLGKKRLGKEFEIIDNNIGLRQENTNNNDSEEHSVSIENAKAAELPAVTATTDSSSQMQNSEEIETQIPLPTLSENNSDELLLINTAKQQKLAQNTEPTLDINIYNVPATAEESTLEPQLEVSIENYSTEEITQPVSSTITTTVTPISSESVINTKSEEEAASWDTIDKLLASTTASNTADSAVPPMQKVASSPQSESVFIRLSNRIKTLERNMSLSGQYLEELSRRYKKQVEELQLALTQQTKMVRFLEEQNLQHQNMDQLNEQRNMQLRLELNELSMQFHACLVVIVFAGCFLFLMLISGLLLFRSLRRQTRELLTQHKTNTTTNNAKFNNRNSKEKLHRRKSYEDMSNHQRSRSKSKEQQRRPSEEAMLILKDCASDGDDVSQQLSGNNKQVRQRKISICYGSNPTTTNINASNVRSKSNRRKGEKLSLPARLQPWQRMEQTEIINPSMPKNTDDSKTKSTNSLSVSNKTRKKAQNQQLNTTAPAKLERENSTNNSLEYADRLLLEDDDLDNFIPNMDLAYNEFMPEGPSGYLLDEDVNDSTAANVSGIEKVKDNTRSKEKKVRRLSSPNFFKSPFSKSVKLKSSANNAKSGKKTPHESTSWEWYRLKKSDQSHKLLQDRHSTTGSLDSSSLSEINFPTSSTQNSFRILEEAILSSGETLSVANNSQPNNGVTSSLGSSNSSGSGSQRSSTSSSVTKKQKSRSFNRILRKVF